MGRSTVEVNPSTMGAALRQMLAQRRLTQRALARQAGVTFRHVWNLCHDRTGLTPKMAAKLRPILGERGVRILLHRDNIHDGRKRTP